MYLRGCPSSLMWGRQPFPYTQSAREFIQLHFSIIIIPPSCRRLSRASYDLSASFFKPRGNLRRFLLQNLSAPAAHASLSRLFSPYPHPTIQVAFFLQFGKPHTRGFPGRRSTFVSIRRHHGQASVCLTSFSLPGYHSSISAASQLTIACVSAPHNTANAARLPQKTTILITPS